MLHDLIATVVPVLVSLLEIVGIIVIVAGSIKGVIAWIKTFFGYDIGHCKLELAEALALGLEFKMGAEILKTVLIGTLDEIMVLGAIIILRVILTFVIHWEIKEEQKNFKRQIDH